MLVLAVLPVISVFAPHSASPTDFVDPRIGTGGLGWGVGGSNPGAQVPFGALRLGPDTALGTLNLEKLGVHYGGYWFNDSHIRAFSHTHLVGAGVADFGNVGVMAVSSLTNKTIQKAGYRSAFSHSGESAKPGLYSVLLETHNVLAELTAAGTHAGLHRYTFRSSKLGAQRVILLDACHTASGDSAHACANATVRVGTYSSSSSSLELSGVVRNRGSLTSRSSRPGGGGVELSFFAVITPRCGAKVIAAGVWQDGLLSAASPMPLRQPLNASSSAGEESAGAYVEFGPCASASNASDATNAGEVVVELRVGISFISIEQARHNLETQAQVQALPQGSSYSVSDTTWRTFESVAANAAAAWDEHLSVVELGDTGDPDLVKQFRSAQYRAALAPTRFGEPSPAMSAQGLEVYVGFDHQTHQWPSYNGTHVSDSHYYTDMSLWDVHRTEFPWLLLTNPQIATDITRSLVRMARDGGRLPRWPLADVYTGCMIGSHGINVLADNCVKGSFEGVADAEQVLRAAFSAALSSVQNDRIDEGNYSSKGYVSFEADERAASLTLSYAFDDWSLWQLATCVAKRFGDPTGELVAAATAAASRSQNYRKLWVPSRQLMCPRLAKSTPLHPLGHVCPPKSLEAVTYPLQSKYVEGDALQWTWFVPGDPEGLVTLFHSPEAFAAKLDAFFANSTRWKFPNTLPNPYYWAGNEPDLLAVWQFVFAGRPDLTQRWSRWLLLHKYSSRPSGVPGNDDFGTMSAWFMFAALGIYPLPGSTRYVLGSPIFPSVMLHLRANASLSNSATVLRVVAHNASRSNMYVANCTLNGMPVKAPFVQHQQLVAGGTLEFWMEDGPSSFWRE